MGQTAEGKSHKGKLEDEIFVAEKSEEIVASIVHFARCSECCPQVVTAMFQSNDAVREKNATNFAA